MLNILARSGHNHLVVKMKTTYRYRGFVNNTVSFLGKESVHIEGFPLQVLEWIYPSRRGEDISLWFVHNGRKTEARKGHSF